MTAGAAAGGAPAGVPGVGAGWLQRVGCCRASNCKVAVLRMARWATSGLMGSNLDSAPYALVGDGFGGEGPELGPIPDRRTNSGRVAVIASTGNGLVKGGQGGFKLWQVANHGRPDNRSVDAKIFVCQQVPHVGSITKLLPQLGL